MSGRAVQKRDDWKEKLEKTKTLTCPTATVRQGREHREQLLWLHPPPAQQLNEQRNFEVPPKSSTASSSGNVPVAKATWQPKARLFFLCFARLFPPQFHW